MDSVTQASLGAIVAYATWNKELRNWSFAWGAVLGTLPDLDILLNPILDDIQRLYWHRGESHSIFFIGIFSFLLSYIMSFIYKDKIGYKKLLIGVFLILATHVAIDYFTIYGTQLLAPISKQGFGLGNFFIIDPIFTIPILIAIIFIVLLPKVFGAKTANFALVFISIYTIYSIMAHSYTNLIFEKKLREKGVIVKDSFTIATPFNTVLWRHVAKVDGGFYIGYYSILANSSNDDIYFQFVPQNNHLIKEFNKQRNIEVLQWFSRGFYIVRQKDEKIILSDIRFGEIRESLDQPISQWNFSFSWKIDKDENRLKKLEDSNNEIKKALQLIYNLMIGRE